MDFLPPLLVLVSMGALLALPVIWLAGRADGRSRMTAPRPESPGDVGPPAPTKVRSPLGVIGLAFSGVAVALCFAGMLGLAVTFTSWGASFDTWFYLTVAGAVGLFPAVAGLAYGLFVTIRAKKTGVRDVPAQWAVRLGVAGLLLMGVTMLASLVFSHLG